MESMSQDRWPSAEEIAILKRSMVRLIPACEQVSEAFYSSLFATHPGLRPLFPEDMFAQQEKLIMMLAHSIDLLEQPETFEESCAALGRRHVAYGAEEGHYPVVSELTLLEMGKAANPPLTPEEGSAWTTLLQMISDAMLRGAHRTTPGPDQA